MTTLRDRLMTAADIGSVPIGHMGTEDEVRQRILAPAGELPAAATVAACVLDLHNGGGLGSLGCRCALSHQPTGRYRARQL